MGCWHGRWNTMIWPCPTCIPPALLPPLRSRLVSGKAPVGKPCSAPSHLGLELCLRIGRAGYDANTRTSRFLQRGQDASAICGAVAGAAVAAKLLGQDSVQIAHAMGIAVRLASGAREANRAGGTVKGFQRRRA